MKIYPEALSHSLMLARWEITLYNLNMTDMRLLFNLQQLDTQLDKDRARLAEIERILNDSTALKKANQRLTQANDRLTKAQLALKRAEQDVQEQQSKIDNNQRKLYGGSVKAPKELEDLQMEAGALNRQLSVLEDKQIEAMIAFEEAEAEKQASETNLETVTQQIADQNQDLTKEQATLSEKVNSVAAERQETASAFEQEILAQYEKLRQTRAGLAVTTVKDNSCAACGSMLTNAQAQAARSPSTIATCEMCGRILYDR